MQDVLIFAEITLREARRRRILWAGLGLGVVYIALYAVGFYYIHQDMVRSTPNIELALNAEFNFVVMAGLYVVSFLGVMLAVLTAVGTLSGEISSQTIQSLAVKPLNRATIVMGKWLGLGTMLTLYIIFLSVGVLAATYALSGYMPRRVVSGVLLIVLQSLVMLSLSVLGGTRLSTVANGVVAFMLYGLAFVGGWIEQIGSILGNEAAVDIGIISSLLVPSEVMWKMAAYLMQPPIVGALGVSPFSFASAPSVAMVIYAVAYVVGVMLAAVYSFARRDL